MASCSGAIWAICLVDLDGDCVEDGTSSRFVIWALGVFCVGDCDALFVDACMLIMLLFSTIRMFGSSFNL
jgi:hypothetical protein